MNMSIHEDTHMKSQFHGTVLANTPLCFITKKIKQIFFFFFTKFRQFPILFPTYLTVRSLCSSCVYTSGFNLIIFLL